MGWTDFEWLSGADPSPDGTSVVYVSDRSGRPQPWVLPLDGGQARLIEVPGSVRRCLWRPDNARLLVVVDLDGGEDHRLAEVDPDTGAVAWLVAQDGVRCEVGVPYGHTGRPYSADGTLLAYASNARDREVFDVRVRDLRTGDDRIVLHGDDRYVPMGFSPDSRLLLVLRLHQNTEHDLFVCDLVDGTTRRVTPDGPAKHQPVAWLPDSSGFYLCTTWGRDFLGLATLSLAGELTWIDAPESDVEGAALSSDGLTLAWSLNEDGYTRLRWAPVGGAARDVEGLPPGVAVTVFGLDGHVPRFAPKGELLVQLGRPDAATDLFLVDLPHGTARQLTDAGAGLPDAMVVPEVLRVTSADGETVPFLLYRPRGASGERPVPLVVTVHGGPEAQSVPTFFPLVQELLSRGIAVAAPNIRGSSGYGMRYQRLIYRDWGGGDLTDLEAVVRRLREVDWVAGDRLGVHGASYGGFAVFACLTMLPGLWRAGVSECGSSDLISDIRSFPPTWRKRAKDWIGDPDDPADVAAMTARSPLEHADRVVAPVLIMHGENDTRVNPEESERMYRRLRELGKPAKLVLHPGVGHEIDRAGLAATTDLIASWFAEHLAL